MPEIYFAFSDESGLFITEGSQKKLHAHPYYVRGTILMPATDWIQLDREYKKLKKYHGVTSPELKWSDLWTLKKMKGKSNYSDYSMFGIPHLHGLTYHDACVVIESIIEFLKNNTNSKIVITFSENPTNAREYIITKFHLQEILQRIQMELKSSESMCILFVDPVNNSKDMMLRNVHRNIVSRGDFINEYTCIKDSLSIEMSHHSSGIQIADFVSGIFNSYLKSIDKGGYTESIHLFETYIHGMLRVGNTGVMGYGIREVPRNDNVRKWFLEHLEARGLS